MVNVFFVLSLFLIFSFVSMLFRIFSFKVKTDIVKIYIYIFYIVSIIFIMINGLMFFDISFELARIVNKVGICLEVILITLAFLIAISLNFKFKLKKIYFSIFVVFISILISFFIFKGESSFVKSNNGVSIRNYYNKKNLNIFFTLSISVYILIYLLPVIIRREKKDFYRMVLLCLPGIVLMLSFFFYFESDIFGDQGYVVFIYPLFTYFFGLPLFFAVKYKLLLDTSLLFDLNTVIRNINEIIIFVDKSGIIRKSNIGVYDINFDEKKEQSIIEFVNPEIWDSSKNQIDSGLSEYEVFDSLIYNIGIEPIPARVEVHKLFDNFNEHNGYIVICEDIRNELNLKNEHKNTLSLNRRLRESLEKDELTGLGSRLNFEKTIEFIIDNASDKSKVSLMIIDLDCFKDVNDNYGHKTGDIILKQFAELLLSYKIENCEFFRWGGDEFIGLFNRMSLDEVFKFAEKIRKDTSEYKFYLNLKLTISVGISKMGGARDTSEVLTSVADKNLYKSKNSGKNRVTM